MAEGSNPSRPAEREEKMEEVKRHVLVPSHDLMSEEETREILAKYGVTKRELPKISVNDPAIKGLGVKQGDVIRIKRESPFTGVSYYYRVVMEE